jgi:hypothetical protein
MDYVTDAALTVVQNKQALGLFQTEFQSSDVFAFEHTINYERLPKSFTISPGVVVPAGGYPSQHTRATYTLGQQRLLSGKVIVGHGSLYNGTLTEVSYAGRAGIVTQFAVEPSISLNWVSLPYGRFSAQQINARFIVTPTPRMMISSLLQFNHSSHTLTSSARLRWEYLPGSELFLVYSDGRSTADSANPAAVPGLLNRSIAVKLTRLLRF